MDNTLKNIVTYICVISILVIVVGVCIIATTEKPHETTSILNNIGGAIGGFTSSIIGITSIVLVFMAYSQQLKANEYLKMEIDLINKSEQDKIKDIRRLIIADLRLNVKQELRNISKELSIKLLDKEGWKTTTINYGVYYHLNTFTFDSVDKIELFKAFPQEYSDLIKIYSNIPLIKTNTYFHFYLKYLEATKNNTITNESKVSEIFNNAEKIKQLCNELVDRFIDPKFLDNTSTFP